LLRRTATTEFRAFTSRSSPVAEKWEPAAAPPLQDVFAARKRFADDNWPHLLGSCSMMKLVSKFALVAAVAALAMAGSTGESSAKGHMAKGKKAAAACTPGALKTAACGPAGCTMQRCWADGKWYPSLFVCMQPWCPK
jgi:hypothetical protein